MANIRNRRMDDPEGANSRIFVGNIPMDTDREILKKKFEGHGPVLGVMVLKGFAFVQFQVEAHAKAAIEKENGTEFNGKKLDVKPAKQNNKGGGGGGMGGQQAPWQEQQGGGHHNFRGGGGGGHRGSRGGRGGGDQAPGPGWGRGVTRGAFGGNRGHFGGHNQGFGGGGGNRGGFNGPGGWGGDGGGGYSDYGDNSEYSDYGDTGYSEEYDEMGDMERFNERLQAEDDDAGYGGQAGGYGGGFANTRGRGRGGGSNPGRGRGGGLNHAGGGNNGVQHQHPPAEQEKPNDVEIIAMDKSLRVYGENLESRLQNMGLSVDILFPNPDIPVGKVLGNIASRGVMFAICLTPDNREHGSVTLNVLQGQQQEHRNMPVDDAMSFISKQFPSLAGGPGPGAGNSVISRPGSSVVPAPSASGHPPDVQKIITFLSDDRPLSIMEYDKMIKYLVSRRTETLKEEYGDNIPAHLQHPPVGPQLDPAKKAKQEEIQNRVQTILRERRDGGRAPGAGMAPSLQAAIDSLVKNGPNLLSGVSQPQASSSYSYQSQSHPGPASSRDYSSGTGGFGGGFGNY